MNSALDEYFPPESHVEIIAEPGAYFMQSAGTVVTNVTGKRRRVEKMIKGGKDLQDAIHYDYYLNESLYTSFTGYIFESEITPVPLKVLWIHI